VNVVNAVKTQFRFEKYFGVNMKNHIHLLLLCRSTAISGERGKGVTVFLIVQT
jgi:hypothetical protein